MKKTAVLIIITVLAAMMFNGCDEQQDAFEEIMQQYCVVLDAGHGGTDGGALGITTGCKESEINLSVTLKVRDLLQSAGIRVVLTRSDEKALCDDSHYSKQKDMQLRGQRIDAAGPDIVVSIHMNSYPNATVHGAQPFYYPDSESGKKLAEYIQSSLKRIIDPNNKRTVKPEDFFLLRTYAGPSALVECGFLTCPAEEKVLLKEEYQDKLAYCIFDGIISYLMLG